MNDTKKLRRARHRRTKNNSKWYILALLFITAKSKKKGGSF